MSRVEVFFNVMRSVNPRFTYLLTLLTYRSEGEPVRSVRVQSSRLQLLVYPVGGVSRPTSDRELVVDHAAAERGGLDGDVPRL